MEPQKKRVVDEDQFAKNIGIMLTEVHEGYAKTELCLEEKHLNGVGIVQGGVIFTLADYAFAAACNEAGVPTVGVNNHISYLKAAKGKKITAEAKEIASSRKLCSYVVTVFDEDGTLLATMQATGYHITA